MPKAFISSARGQRLRWLGKRRRRVRVATVLAALPPPTVRAADFSRFHQPQPTLTAPPSPPLPPDPRPS